jgi:tRNA nucleotidyltransferase/poly(A) polymerase
MLSYQIGHDFELEIQKLIQSDVLSEWKNNIFSVGGFVRDYLIQRDSYDIDLMVTIPGGAENLAKQLKLHFMNEVTTPLQMGAMYPIWSFEFRSGRFKGLKIDIAESQKEMFPKNDERQRVTSFGSFAEDIQRRDFTVNMLARDLTTDQVIDESRFGRADLENKILRSHPAVDANKILSDDPLRIIRAVRFSCTHDFKIDSTLFGKMLSQAGRIQIVSAERILLELTKIINAGKLPLAVDLFLELNLIKLLFSDAVVRQLADHKIKDQIFNVMQTTPNSSAYQLAALFYFLENSETEDVMAHLKLSQVIKRNIKDIIGSTEALLSLDTDSFTEVRAFLRSCDLDFDSLGAFAKGVSADFDSIGFTTNLQRARSVPISKKPILNGIEISKLLNVSGVEIKKAQRLLFKIEDQYVFENAKSLSVDQAQVLLFENWSMLSNRPK